MHISAKMLLAILPIGIAGALGGTGAQAQTIVSGAHTIALKSGESAELGNLYYISNCKSLLTSAPQVEVIDGPPGVTASVREDMVPARLQKCPSPVKGGKLFVAVKEIGDQSFPTLTLRITYRTRDGERKLSHVFNLELFP